ncbi:c-type cytochrome domain-containing protein [uncultured Kriegella sp.]|uniref:c-type cytochrome domain-containing protein n=1 Tax=uncultured Kriegella sp. TaxID=1798910 RepID=UPI0030D84F71|tara:strand:+ start:86253 stop:87713 length:1461 start_codon:yes stop_codon:yes gene_type:complete
MTSTTTKNRRVDLLIFGLSVFLVFCLIFESFLRLPILIAWLGRWHPLILHFPIVLLLIAAFLGLTGKNVPRALLTVATVTALVTAISGFFLGKEAVEKGNLLFWHQWLGAGTALVAVVWYWLDGEGFGNTVYTKALQVLLVVLVGFTGHFGGMITHGENFLALPTEKSMDGPIPDNPLIYQHVVARILKNNCVSCHNPNKQKGELLMTDLDGLLKGGESGSTLVPGNPEKSEIIKRLYLPLADEEHMPPEGEKPLSTSEIQILERWVALGASDTVRLNHLGANEPLASLVKEMMEPDPMEKWAKLPKVADSTIQRLSSDYLTIGRIAGSTDALHINMYKPPTYDPRLILDLKAISKNIVQMDLSGLPIGEQEMELVGSCENLEWLEVDRTPINDTQIEGLKNLSNLHTLKVYGTDIGDPSAAVFKNLTKLKSLYLWDTNISQSALDNLRNAAPALLIDNGIDAAIQPFFVDRDSIPISGNQDRAIE